MKNYDGIIEQLHFINQTQAEMQNELYVEKKRNISRIIAIWIEWKVVSDSMECYCCLRKVQDLLTDGTTPYGRRFGESFKGPIVPFGAHVEYLPNSKSFTLNFGELEKSCELSWFHRLSTPHHSVESVSNQNLSGDGEEFTKVPKAIAAAKSYSHVQFIRIWQVL